MARETEEVPSGHIAGRRYREITARDPMIHKSVARAVNGLREFLEVERKRIPGNVLFEADGLECSPFAGYEASVRPPITTQTG
jgi:hypothetical protein